MITSSKFFIYFKSLFSGFSIRKLLNFLSVLAIGLFVGVFLTFKYCHRPKQPAIVIHDTIPGDSVAVYFSIDKPVPYEIIRYCDTGSVRVIYRQLDSMELINIILCYFTKNIYLDTLKNDTSALVCVMDTVFKNEIQNRVLIFQNRRPTAINTFMPAEKPRNRLFIGAVAGGNRKGFDFGPSALFVSKKSIAFGYQYEVLNKRHLISLYWTPFKASK